MAPTLEEVGTKRKRRALPAVVGSLQITIEGHSVGEWTCKYLVRKWRIHTNCTGFLLVSEALSCGNQVAPSGSVELTLSKLTLDTPKSQQINGFGYRLCQVIISKLNKRKTHFQLYELSAHSKGAERRTS